MNRVSGWESQKSRWNEIRIKKFRTHPEVSGSYPKGYSLVSPRVLVHSMPISKGSLIPYEIVRPAFTEAEQRAVARYRGAAGSRTRVQRKCLTAFYMLSHRSDIRRSTSPMTALCTPLFPEFRSDAGTNIRPSLQKVYTRQRFVSGVKRAA